MHIFIHVHTYTHTPVAIKEREGVDSLDAFMSNVKGRLDRSKRMELTQQLHGLKNVSNCRTDPTNYWVQGQHNFWVKMVPLLVHVWRMVGWAN